MSKIKLNQALKLKEIAPLIGATLTNSDGERIISAVGNIKNGQPGQVTFLANPLYKQYLGDTKCSAVICTAFDAKSCNTASLVTDNPRLALAKLLELCVKPKQNEYKIHPSVVIGNNCNISNKVEIHPNCVIGDNVIIEDNVVMHAGVVIGNDCVIGHNTTFYANVTLYNNTKIGNNSIVHANTVIGSDGFGYANDNGNWVKMPHFGGVVIGNHTEIGSNTSIDRGCLDNTVIGDGVIIDNLVQVAHNVSIGDFTAIAGCVAIAGSTSIGKKCMIGGKCAINGHISIADGVIITAFSGVLRSIDTPGMYSSGMPACKNKEWRKNISKFYTLSDMAKRLRNVEKTLKETINSTNER